jgi:hypothetical protein
MQDDATAAEVVANLSIAAKEISRGTDVRIGKMRMLGVMAACLVACLTISSGAVTAQPVTGWGTLKGRIVFDGQPPAPEPLDITRDQEVCGELRLVDESLVVDPENRGIRHVAVWLDSRDAVPVHPDLMAFPEMLTVLDNRQCRFEPRMVAVRTGQVMALKNSDPIAHNAAVFARRNQPFSEIIPFDQPLQKKFARAETLPVRVDCSIHAWMKAWIIILDHPCVAVTGPDGRFEIRNIPAGDWKFHFWHERPGNLLQLRQGDSMVALDKGQWSITIHPDGEHDLGVLKVDAAGLAPKK